MHRYSKKKNIIAFLKLCIIAYFEPHVLMLIPSYQKTAFVIIHFHVIILKPRYWDFRIFPDLFKTFSILWSQINRVIHDRNYQNSKPFETTRHHPKPSEAIRNHPPKTIHRHRAHPQPARNYTNQSVTLLIHVKIRRYCQNYPKTVKGVGWRHPESLLKQS